MLLRAFSSIIACLILCYALLLMLPANNRQAPPADYQSNTFDIIAHRNGRALVPGNTFEAAINALNVGADVLEIDVHLTADNVLVVRHDAGNGIPLPCAPCATTSTVCTAWYSGVVALHSKVAFE